MLPFVPLLPIVSATRKLPDHSGEKRKRIALRRVFSKCLKDRQHLHCSRGPRVCGPAQRVCVYVCGPSRIRSQIPESRFSQVTIIACVLSNDRTEREAENERESGDHHLQRRVVWLAMQQRTNESVTAAAVPEHEPSVANARPDYQTDLTTREVQ